MDSVLTKKVSGFTVRHAIIIGVLVLSFSASFLIRMQPMEYGYELNEFDPFYNYRATEFLVTNGLEEYYAWHEYESWYPEGRNISATSQVMLHFTAAATYTIFGGSMSLYDYTIIFPVIFGSFTAIVMFALVRTIGGTLAGLAASLLFSVSVPILVRGMMGWFKSEPLGLFYGLLGVYLLLSGIKSENKKIAIAKLIGSGVFLAFGLASWGGNQFFIIPIGVFFLALPFLRSDHKFQIWAIPIFCASFILTVPNFERPGIDFITGFGGLAIIGPTIFLVACNIVQIISKQHALRNGLLLLAATMTSGIALIVASFSTNILNLPSGRYLNAINPFLINIDPLTDSVSEHATTAISTSFFFHSILMVFAGIGIWIILSKKSTNTKNSDLLGFALIISIVGIYISSAFVRLEVFASIGIIILSSVALSVLFKEVFANGNSSNIVFKGGFCAGIFILLFIPVFVPAQGNWIDSVKFPPVILTGGNQFGVTSSDWPVTLEWLSENTPEDSVIAAWWDYGYWITTVSDRTTLADNATMNSTRIQNIAKMFLSQPDDAWRQLQDMDADYVLIFISAAKTESDSTVPLYQLVGGGDESKKQWFIRIAKEPLSDYIYDDGMSATPHFWANTTLGNMIPYSPALYVDLANQRQSPTYVSGYTGIYVKDVKYPEDHNGPFRLAYASPSYSEDVPISIGIFVYEVNKDYTP